MPIEDCARPPDFDPGSIYELILGLFEQFALRNVHPICRCANESSHTSTFDHTSNTLCGFEQHRDGSHVRSSARTKNNLIGASIQLVVRKCRKENVDSCTSTSDETRKIDSAGQALLVAAIIVAFHPDRDALQKLYDSVFPQVDSVHIIDNTPIGRTSCVSSFSFEVIEIGENIGLAAAQNIGVERAIETGATHLLFLDQDSLPDAHMVEALYKDWLEITAEGHRVGAVGPTCSDPLTGKHTPFFRLSKFGLLQIAGSGHTTQSDVLVSSWMLVPLDVWNVVGPFRSDLFIDSVDNEWCMRATLAGYELFGSVHATLHHGIGESRRRIWIGAWRNVSIHHPLRDYYKVRNVVLAFCRPIRSGRWFNYSLWYVLRTIVRIACLPQRRTRFRLVLLGLWHGVTNRGGPIPEGQL
jgi:rhamnosyltransferase